MFYSSYCGTVVEPREDQLFSRFPLARVEAWNYTLDRRKDGMPCKEFIEISTLP